MLNPSYQQISVSVLFVNEKPMDFRDEIVPDKENRAGILAAFLAFLIQTDAISAETDETLDFTNKASLSIVLFYRFCLLFASMPFHLSYTYFRRKLKLVYIKCFSVFCYLASLY